MNCVIIYSSTLTLKIICTFSKNRMDMHHKTWTDPCPQYSLLYFTWKPICITFLKNMLMLKYMCITQGTYPITLISVSKFCNMVIKIKYMSIFTYSDKVPFPLNHKI